MFSGRSGRGKRRGASTSIRRRTTSARPSALPRPALPATPKEVDAVMGDGKTGAGRDTFRQRLRVRFGDRRLHVRDASAAETRKVMVGPGIGVEPGSWPGKFTEKPRLHEQPKVPVDRAQAHPRRSADDQSVDFLGSRVRLDAPDHLEHRLARSGKPEAPVPQCDIGTLDARRAGAVRSPFDSLFRDDSHFHRPLPANVTVRALALPVKKSCDSVGSRQD